MLETIRNFGIIAHIDAGKTTTSEGILVHTGKEHRLGFVDEGTATMDWMEEEQKRGITITSAATTVHWKKHVFNLIDTPGHVDFTAEVERSLRVLDGAVGVFCGVGGVEAQSETVWKQADRYRVPRLAYVNKLDRVGADFGRVVADIRKRLHDRAVPVQVPLGSEEDFRGVVDLVRWKVLAFPGDDPAGAPAESEPDGDVAAAARPWREALLEAAADQDDEVMALVLDAKPVPDALLKRAIRRGTLSRALTPILAGSSLRDIGIPPLLDAIIDYLPSPADMPPVEAKDPRTGQSVARRPDPGAPFCALAFKTFTDRHGELTYLRIYAGQAVAGMAVDNPRSNKKERLQRIFRMHAAQREAIDRAGPGEIVAVVGLRWTATGDTLCDPKHPAVLERMEFPETVISVAIEPRSSSDRDKLFAVLATLAKDDPTFRQRIDEETGQTVISGMGELHLEILKGRILREFNVDAHVGEPRVAYKETVKGPARASESVELRGGDKVQFGRVDLSVEANPGHLAPTIREATPAHLERDLRRYVPAIRDGIEGALLSGPAAGFPMVYIAVTITGGEVRPESTEPAYTAAATHALRRALAAAGTQILEPFMKFEVTTPAEHLGGVLPDLTSRRALIQDVQTGVAAARVVGLVPLAEVFGYTTTLRSLTQGRGTCVLEVHDYRPLPPEERIRRFGDLA